MPSPDCGLHNADLAKTATRITRGQGYRDCSTVCVIPTRGMIDARVLGSWFSLIPPMNQKFHRWFMCGMEVGAAYETAVDQTLAHPELQKWTYLLTLEEDNIPPPDGLLKLIESIETDKRLGAVGGLYYTKGEGGQPMIYGDPAEMPKSFRPQVPRPDTLQPCNGLGMGLTLFRLRMFKDREFVRPWFRSLQEFKPGVGTQMMTQDLYFFEQAGRIGWRFACDTRVKVGHLDSASGIVW